MHLVGFIIRIYHGARSPERQKCASLYDETDGDCTILKNKHFINCTNVVMFAFSEIQGLWLV